MKSMLRALPTVWIGVMLVAGCAGGGAQEGGRPSTSLPPAGSSNPDSSTSASTTIATQSSAPSPSTTTETAPTTTTAPVAGLEGIDWDNSGIRRACRVDDPITGTRCSQVVHDPAGAPISYDPTTRTLTRHVREDGEFVEAVLPESYGDDVWLVAAGPDDVVYLNVVAGLGGEGSADLVAVALASGDAGREIERAAGSGNAGSDSDFVVTPDGLVVTDWYGQGQRPAADRSLAMAWVERDAGDDDSPATGADPFPNGVRSITIDAYESTVTVNGRTWQLTGRAADIQPTGMPPIVGTFDGGFVARYDQVSDAYDSVVVRGWPDGSVDEWLVEGGPDGTGWAIVPEPMGTVLIGNGDTFARAAPFEARPPRWPGRLDVDFETGDVPVDELNDSLTTLDSSIIEPPWGTDPIAFADAVAGHLSSPAELRTIEYIEANPQQVIVAVTDEGLLDDSVYATRLTMTIVSDLRSVKTITWLNSCQPGRGHQNYQAAYCI